MKQKHGVLIDPFTRTISIVTYGDGNHNLSDWYRLMDCSCIDMRDIGTHPAGKGKGTRLNLVCDDEGLYNQGHKQRFFKLRGYPHMLAGKCLIVAVNAPDTVELADPEVIVAMLDKMRLIEWQDERLRFRDITTSEDTYDHPAFGSMQRLTQTPHFSLATDEELANEH